MVEELHLGGKKQKQQTVFISYFGAKKKKISKRKQFLSDLTGKSIHMIFGSTEVKVNFHKTSG